MDLLDIGKKYPVVAALILGSAWISVDKDIKDGVFFLVIGFILIILLWCLERTWIEHKFNRGMLTDQ